MRMMLTKEVELSSKSFNAPVMAWIRFQRIHCHWTPNSTKPQTSRR